MVKGSAVPFGEDSFPENTTGGNADEGEGK